MEKLVMGFIKPITIFMKNNGLFPGFVLIMLESIIPMLPLSAFILLNVMTYGNIIGIIISWLGTICGSMLAFNLVRKLKSYVKEKTKGKFDKISLYLDKVPFTSVAILLAIPFTPAFAVNIGAGLSNISKKKYVTALIIGKLPMVYFWGIIGKGLIESITDIKILLKIIIMVIITFIISKLANKRINWEE